MIESTVVKGYYDELERAKLPGYVCRYDMMDAGEDFDAPLPEGTIVRPHPAHDLTPRQAHVQAAMGTVRSKVA
jgi:hypothetical protein